MLATAAVWLVPLLGVAMFALFGVGRNRALKRRAADPLAAPTGVGAFEGAVFALLGLLVAFTFAGAATRFDARKQQVIDEANGIGTAYLRIDLLPAEAQPALRDSFRKYVEARLAVYRAVPDLEAVDRALVTSNALQTSIWEAAVAATRTTPSHVAMLTFPPLNDMFDLASTRTATARWMHTPPVVFGMLALVAVVCALLAGYGTAASKRDVWVHAAGFVTLICLATYVILDLEYPRVGFFRVDEIDQVMLDLRATMK